MGENAWEISAVVHILLMGRMDSVHASTNLQGSQVITF